jgi:hypothetical protein
MKEDTGKEAAAVPVANAKIEAPDEAQEKEPTELSEDDLDKVSGGVRRVVKVVNGKKY